MSFGQPKKETEAQRVKRWKKKNPDKVHNQLRRRRGRILAERRAQDPTGELDYGPIDGVDAPYRDPDSSEMPPAPPPVKPPPPPGIPDPPELIEEMTREEKRITLAKLRAEIDKMPDDPTLRRYDPYRKRL